MIEQIERLTREATISYGVGVESCDLKKFLVGETLNGCCVFAWGHGICPLEDTQLPIQHGVTGKAVKPQLEFL